jgi:hypothetical protein
MESVSWRRRRAIRREKFFAGLLGRFADGPEDPEESGAIGVEAGDPVCEEVGEFGGVDGGFEGDAETGGGVDGRV